MLLTTLFQTELADNKDSQWLLVLLTTLFALFETKLADVQNSISTSGVDGCLATCEELELLEFCI